MTQDVFVKTSIHFYHMPRTDQLPTMELSGPSLADPKTPAPPVPGGVFLSRNVTIKRACRLVKAGTLQIYLSAIRMSEQEIFKYASLTWKNIHMSLFSDVCLYSNTFHSSKNSPNTMQEERHLDVLFTVFSRVPILIWRMFQLPTQIWCFGLHAFVSISTNMFKTLCGSDGSFSTVYLSTAASLSENCTVHEDCGASRHFFSSCQYLIQHFIS